MASEKKDKVSFRVEWHFDADSEEGRLFAYLNSLGSEKRSKVVNLLKAAIYPEVLYETGGLDELHRIHVLTLQLEQRAWYFRKLLDLPEKEATSIPLAARTGEPEPEISHSYFAPPEIAIDENGKSAISQMSPQPPFKIVMNENGELTVVSTFDGETVN